MLFDSGVSSIFTSSHYGAVDDWTPRFSDSFVRCNVSVTSVQREFRIKHETPSFVEFNHFGLVYWSIKIHQKLHERFEPLKMWNAFDKPSFIHSSSPTRSAWQNVTELRLSNRSVRRILLMKLRFHPHKLAFVQQLQPGDAHVWWSSFLSEWHG